MHVVNAIIYYFVLIFAGLTLSLLVFCIPFTRSIFHSFKEKFGDRFKSEIVRYIMILAFVIIFMILFESLFAYSTLKTHFRKGRGKGTQFTFNEAALETLNLIPASSRNNYLLQLKELREYYLAERNIILSCAAIFVFFVFQRMLYNISKLAQLQHQVSIIKNKPKQEIIVRH